MRVHHIRVSALRKHEAKEREFWAMIGFGETMLPPRDRRGKMLWLVNAAGFAIHVEFVDAFDHYSHDLNHVALVVGKRRLKQIIKMLTDFGHPVEDAKKYFGSARVFTESPSGQIIELMERAPNIKAGVPMEGRP